MKAGFTTLAQVLAVCLSLALLGGYVWYRHDQQQKTQARIEAENKARERAIETARKRMANDEGLTFEEVSEAVMYSSKSGPVLMPSSKIGTIPPELMEGITQQQDWPVEPAKVEEDVTLLPGPKSAPLMPSSKQGGVKLEDLPGLKNLFKEEEKKPKKQSSEK